MKILSASQIREADAHTIQHEPVSSIDLMERAARACAERIAVLLEKNSKVLVFCGKGNNGGDGLAITRMLAEKNVEAKGFIVEHSDSASADFSTNLKRLEQTNVSVEHIKSVEELHLPSESGYVIIDALLGTGLNKPVTGLLGEIIDKINASGIPVISIDVPSGLYCDVKPDHKHIIRARKTFTFQRPKFTFLFADFAPYVGDLEILDIGLDERFIESLPSQYYFTHGNDVRVLFRKRNKFSHKGTYGHALLIAGSKGKAGAAVMAARACLRSGAGLLTTQLPAACVNIMQTSVPEAMVNADENEKYVSGFPKNTAFDAIGMGPGIGTEKETAQLLKVLIQNTQVPLVLDADALNILAENKTWISFLPPMTVVTPHPKEFDRLAGTHTSDFDRLQTCREFAFKHRVVVVLKGAYTAVVLPDRSVHFNSTGNPSLAKGGSGDVLTGIILGLLSQEYSPEQACMIACFVHGHAADLYIEKERSEMSMLASDLIELLPVAFHL